VACGGGAPVVDVGVGVCESGVLVGGVGGGWWWWLEVGDGVESVELEEGEEGEGCEEG